MFTMKPKIHTEKGQHIVQPMVLVKLYSYLQNNKLIPLILSKTNPKRIRDNTSYSEAVSQSLFYDSEETPWPFFSCKIKHSTGGLLAVSEFSLLSCWSLLGHAGRHVNSSCELYILIQRQKERTLAWRRLLKPQTLPQRHTFSKYQYLHKECHIS